jgi:PAS domain S-box-containing protein
MMWSCNSVGRRTFHNRAWLEFAGQTLEQVLADSRCNWIHPDDVSRWREAWQRSLTSQQTFSLEYRLRRADGQYRWILETAAPLFENGLFTGFLATCVDTTEHVDQRKQAEQQLRATAERLKAILDHAPVGILINTRDGRLVECNAAHERITGRSAEELKGAAFADYTHPEDLARNLELFEQLNDGKLPSLEIEKRYLRKDGQVIWVRAIASLLNKDLNIGIVEDVTARKQAELQLRDTAERLKKILENAPVGIVIGNRQGLMEETNAAFQQMTGYSAEELRGMSFQALTHPEDRPRNRDLVEGLMQGRLKTYDYEKRYLLKDNKVIWVRVIGSRLDAEHKVSIIEDITARKETEEQLRQTEARLRRLIDSNVVGVMLTNSRGAILDANNALHRMTGHTREEFNSLGWRDLTPAEYHVLDDAALREIAETGAFRPFEKEFYRKDGSRLPVIVGGAATEGDEAIVFVLDLTERKKAQAEVERLARIVESADDAIVSLSLDGTILSWNKGAERLFGYLRDEMIGASESVLLPVDRSREAETVRQVVATGKGVDHFGAVRLTKSGEEKPIGLTISPLRDERGRIIGISKIGRDRTEIIKNAQLEEQLRQAQKLEAVGRLAGGVAHDFNNLLMVISSYAQMLEDDLDPNHKLHKYIQEILKASERAASLTQQMLAFSRKQVLAPRIIDLNAAVEETMKMVRRVIGEHIELVFRPGNPLSPIEADLGQITQVLLNLCVNARDAMPAGGKLTIETQDAEIDAKAASLHQSFMPGKYVMLSVSDTGAGMTKEVQERIFEPFFTTKALGRGTGLGLSTVYGIVKQSGGYIWVYSEPEHGSCFKLYFPAAAGAVVQTRKKTGVHDGQGETILVVEDEEALRIAVCEHLKGRGYEILTAQNGQEAVQIAETHPGPIHLLLTDVIMPRMSGPEVANRLAEMPNRQKVATLFMSGYPHDAIMDHAVLQPGAPLIQKPFSLATLTARLREELQRAPVA